MQLRQLRAMAVNGSLAKAAPLHEVVERIEFVQYDPIRRPARAQDLILHQRVRGYRAGDLDRAYERLEIEEDYMHVYGAMTHEAFSLLHPRGDGWRPKGLEADVLAYVRSHGRTH